MAKDNSTLQEEFFVRYKDYLVPIEMKAGGDNSKSLSALIQSDNYPEIRFEIKIAKGNIGFDSSVCAFLTLLRFPYQRISFNISF